MTEIKCLVCLKVHDLPLCCGMIRTGEKEGTWQCHCNGVQCHAWVKFCEVLGGTNATPDRIPKPDRRAAIAHTKGLS